MPTVEHAKLIPLDNDQPQNGDAITVQFNPANLRVTMSNTLRADNRSGGSSPNTAQHVDKSSSTLTIELIFDTTNDSSDVRAKTQAIADKFMKPEDDGRAPKRCLFQWGRFGFRGLVTSYGETLDFFAPEGVPLRATVSLTLTEDRFQDMKGDDSVHAAARNTPSFSPAPSLPEAGPPPGAPATDWQSTALYNGIESPRFPDVAGILVPPAPPSIGTGGGFSYGASTTLGTAISGAFGGGKGG
jgi:hypothetical protein